MAHMHTRQNLTYTYLRNSVRDTRMCSWNIVGWMDLFAVCESVHINCDMSETEILANGFFSAFSTDSHIRFHKYI